MEENKMPLIGDHAPEFHAMTTQGKIDFPLIHFILILAGSKVSKH